MKQYLELMDKILHEGAEKSDRTGTGTLSLFGEQLRFDLAKGFPLLTTKRMFFKGIVYELLWFLRGDTNIKYLNEHGVHIWDSWSDENGNVNKIYGKTWLDFGGVNQIAEAINLLQTNPDSRRIIVSAWNPPDIPQMVMTPCFTEEFLVLTNNGYKFIKDVEENDLVYTDSGIYHKVLHKFTTNYTGELRQLEYYNNNESIVCTPNHPFLVLKKGFVLCKDIIPGDYIALKRHKTKKLIPDLEYKIRRGYRSKRSTTVITKRFTPTLDDMFMMGYFVGDGWASHKHDLVSFAINIEDGEEILNKLRLSIKISRQRKSKALRIKNSKVHSYSTRSKKWNPILRQFGYRAYGKKIPEWVFNLPHKYIYRFLEGYAVADGRNRTFDFTTVSADLAYGIQRLLAVVGIPTRIFYQKRPPTTIIENRLVKQRDTYTVTQILGKQCIIDENYIWYQVYNNESFKCKSRLVYNLDIDQDHTYTINNMVTHNCHVLFQLYVVNNKLSCHMYQRSADYFLGVPFNIASYALLTQMMAEICKFDLGDLIISFGDVHLYLNHLDQAREQVFRSPYALSEVLLATTPKNIFSFAFDDFCLVNYYHQEAIKAEISV